MKVLYRQYQESDAAGLQQLLVELGYPLEIFQLSQNVDAIREKGGAVIVAVMDAQLIGSVCAITDARLAEGIYGEIVSLVVSEKYRGAGIGRVLVQEAESWIAGRADKVRVRANVIRSKAHLFYQAQGYQEIKEQKVFVKQL